MGKQFVPNPNPYDWKVDECDNYMTPHVKGPRVVLERNGKTKRFTTQEAVDTAWANGWHDVGRPQTADVVLAPSDPDDDVPSGPLSNRVLKNMNKGELIAHGKGLGLTLDEEMLNDDMRSLIQIQEAKVSEDEEDDD